MKINNCCFSTKGYNKACWTIEDKCNLNCDFCFHNQFQQSPQTMERRKRDYSDVILMLREGNIKHVILSGGEPLMSRDLFDIIALLEQNEFIISICTNAVLATPQLCDRLSKTKVEKVTVNLASICDRSGRIIDSKNSISVIAGIHNLVLSGFSVTLNNILHNSSTRETLLQNIAFGTQIGADTMSFTVPVCKSSCECCPSEFFIHDQKVQALRALLEEIEQELTPSLSIIFNYPDCDLDTCPANREIFGIGTNKILSTCLVKQYQASEK